MGSSSPSLYPPLPQGEYIRLLELQPGSQHDGLSGRLSFSSLSLASSSYIAISYVWGAPTLSKVISVSGGVLAITQNAYEVLSSVRSINQPVVVWLDAICINQQDLAERESQVMFMHRVYSMAKRTVIWLGPSGDNSDEVFYYANSLDANALLKEYIPYLNYGPGPGHWERKSHVLDVLTGLSNKASLVNSCAQLLLRIWFTRVWIVQEAAMCADTVVCCGSEKVAWLQIFALAWLFLPRWTMSWPDWFMKDYDILEPALMTILGIQRFRLRASQIEQNESFVPLSTFLSLLENSWRQNSTDPRDKIYAMRHLASDLTGGHHDWAPKPDYRITWQQLYTDLATRLVEKGASEVLGLSGIIRQGDDSNLPSWAPDWRTWPRIQFLVHPEWFAGSRRAFKGKVYKLSKKRQRQLAAWIGAASLTNLPMLKQQPQTCLNLPVIMQDKIQYLGGVAKGWCKYKDIVTQNIIVETLDQTNLNFIKSIGRSVYITEQPLIEVYNTTLIAKTTDQDTIASPEFCAGAEVWRKWLHDGADLDHVPPYHEAIDNIDEFRQSQFCMIAHGFMCLVPAMTQSTDIVAILKSYNMPVVLRPVMGGEFYVLLGDCYVHGMMENQASCLIDEFSIKIRDGQRSWKAEGDIRRNGKSMEAGKYLEVLETLGEQPIDLL